jgi:hypothetical protein
MLSNIQNIRLSTILLESTWTSVVKAVLLLAKVVLDEGPKINTDYRFSFLTIFYFFFTNLQSLIGTYTV